jgi:predicted GIY-YIG superfamily endonuclease
LPWFVYILRCSDGSYYVGHTEDVPARMQRHQDATGAAWTAARRPVSLVFEEEHPSEAAAVARERQIKGWSRQKKEALIAGKLTILKTLNGVESLAVRISLAPGRSFAHVRLHGSGRCSRAGPGRIEELRRPEIAEMLLTKPQ